MDFNFTKFYQLGNGGDLVFQKDLEALSACLDRPFPEFFGKQLDDQPGGELQWVIVADLRGKIEPPTSEHLRFTVKENNWLDGLARAMQEALARLCGQNVQQIQNLRFVHYARHDEEGKPMELHAHKELRHHVDHLDYMLYETRKELDNARNHANAKYIVEKEMSSTITILAQERKTLRRQRDTKDRTIARLRSRIAALERTIEDQEAQLEEVEEEGEDLRRENAALLSDDDDFQEEEMDMEADTDEDDLHFIDDDGNWEGILEEEDPEEVLFEDEEDEEPEVPGVDRW
jgi:flagellar motility protein MotE (MotC chaperone)